MADQSNEFAHGCNSVDKTMTQSMAAASISEPVSTSQHALLLHPSCSSNAEDLKFSRCTNVRRRLPRGMGKELAEHFIYEGELHSATGQQQTMEYEAKKENKENLLQVDPVAEEKEEEESLRIPAWQKSSRSESRRGRRGVVQIPGVEEEESLRIQAW